MSTGANGDGSASNGEFIATLPCRSLLDAALCAGWFTNARLWWWSFNGEILARKPLAKPSGNRLRDGLEVVTNRGGS